MYYATNLENADKIPDALRLENMSVLTFNSIWLINEILFVI